MRVEPECATCLISRGIKEIELSVANPEEQMRAVTALLKLVAQQFSSNSIPAQLGTERDLLIQRITGNSDPYLAKKRESNEIALKLLPRLTTLVNNIEDPYQKLRKALVLSAAANSIEFDIQGHQIDLNQVGKLLEVAEEQLSVDDSQKLFDILKKPQNLLFLCDNAGEIAIDTILVRELTGLGATVTAVVRGGPILNDALLVDAKSVGMDKAAANVITIGGPVVGVPPIHCTSPEFQVAYKKADLIVAKGMGNWESLPEIHPPVPVVYILRTKCRPIAQSLNVPHQSNVIKAIFP